MTFGANLGDNINRFRLNNGCGHDDAQAQAQVAAIVRGVCESCDPLRDRPKQLGVGVGGICTAVDQARLICMEQYELEAQASESTAISNRSYWPTKGTNIHK